MNIDMIKKVYSLLGHDTNHYHSDSPAFAVKVPVINGFR
jgi:hypothetical protein